MKEIVPLHPEHRKRMSSFGKIIQKRQHYYRKLRSVMHHDFAKVIQDDVNVCVCCGQEFKGKSIGPHYKNSKKCAEFKKQILEERGLRNGRGQLTVQDINQVLGQKLKRDEGLKEEIEGLKEIEDDGSDIFKMEEELYSMNMDVDDFFYSDQAE